MPSGLFQYLYLSDYWKPPTLFGLAGRYGFDLESLIYAFASPAVVFAMYGLFQERILKKEIRRQLNWTEGWIYFAVAILIFVMSYLAGLNSIYASHVALLITSLYGLWRTKVNLRLLAMTTSLFTLLYTIAFLGVHLYEPSYITTYWKLDALSGVLFSGIPLEELLFGFFQGFSTRCFQQCC